MAKAAFRSVDDYIARQGGDAQAILRRVRGIIRKALPGAEEVISYQIPAYKMHGTYVVYFAGWKKHYSLYPASDRLVAAFEVAVGVGNGGVEEAVRLAADLVRGAIVDAQGPRAPAHVDA